MSLRAQGPSAGPAGIDQPAAAADKQESHRTVVHDYDSGRSRGLFMACDENADDRLDLFETRAAMRGLGDPTSPEWFRRLDSNRDGYLDWPEFDRYYKVLVRSGNTLHLWLCRPEPTIVDPATPAPAAPESKGGRRTFDLFDTNRDGSLDENEAEAMLRELGIPTAVLGMLKALDTNRDGRWTEQELAPALQKLNLTVFPTAAPADSKTPAGGRLPAHWTAIDVDGNQLIDARELARALRRVDPQLDRWAPRILQARDRNGDGMIQASELPATAEPGPKAVVRQSKVR